MHIEIQRDSDWAIVRIDDAVVYEGVDVMHSTWCKILQFMGASVAFMQGEFQDAEHTKFLPRNTELFAKMYNVAQADGM